MSPTSLLAKWALILSPLMYIRQYHHFLIKALAKTPLFFPQLDDCFQHTKAAVKDNNKTQVKYGHK